MSYLFKAWVQAGFAPIHVRDIIDIRFPGFNQHERLDVFRQIVDEFDQVNTWAGFSLVQRHFGEKYAYFTGDTDAPNLFSAIDRMRETHHSHWTQAQQLPQMMQVHDQKEGDPIGTLRDYFANRLLSTLDIPGWMAWEEGLHDRASQMDDTDILRRQLANLARAIAAFPAKTVVQSLGMPTLVWAYGRAKFSLFQDDQAHTVSMLDLGADKIGLGGSNMTSIAGSLSGAESIYNKAIERFFPTFIRNVRLHTLSSRPPVKPSLLAELLQVHRIYLDPMRLMMGGK